MDMSHRKVALITGSTHGIGEAIALELAKEGYNVVLNGASTKVLSTEIINQLKNIYQDDSRFKYEYIKADISKVEDRKGIVKKIKERFGRIDVLVNNAGVAPKERKDILKATEESFEWVIKVNLQGPYFLTQQVANWMIQLQTEFNSTNQNFQPYIINIGSLSSYTSSPSRGEYCVSKAGMSMMTKLYADRLAEYGIMVFEIQPGIIETPMTEKVTDKYDKLIEEGLTPIKRWGQPIDIARAVIGIVNGMIPFSTGDILHIDGGFHLHRL